MKNIPKIYGVLGVILALSTAPAFATGGNEAPSTWDKVRSALDKVRSTASWLYANPKEALSKGMQFVESLDLPNKIKAADPWANTAMLVASTALVGSAAAVTQGWSIPLFNATTNLPWVLVTIGSLWGNARMLKGSLEDLSHAIDDKRKNEGKESITPPFLLSEKKAWSEKLSYRMLLNLMGFSASAVAYRMGIPNAGELTSINFALLSLIGAQGWLRQKTEQLYEARQKTKQLKKELKALDPKYFDQKQYDAKKAGKNQIEDQD